MSSHRYYALATVMTTVRSGIPAPQRSNELDVKIEADKVAPFVIVTPRSGVTNIEGLIRN
jgi:hypothetical protein